MVDERDLVINPIVPESVQHNARVHLPYQVLVFVCILIHLSQVISQIRSLTASLFGIAAGILGLESYPGFIFYFIGTLIVSALIWGVLAEGKPTRYFENQFSGLWGKDLVGGLSSFVLTWTLFYGLVRS